MKVALSVFNNCISTVFDAADHLLIMETDNACVPKRKVFKFDGPDPATRAAQLREQGIEILICGAISRPMEASIIQSGITIYPFVRGPVEKVFEAYQNQQLEQADFLLPGCRRGFRGLRRQHGRPCRFK